MKIVEDITYDLSDIVNQIEKAFGFFYVERTDHSGYIILDDNTELDLTFSEDEKVLDSASIKTTSQIDLTENTIEASTIISSIEAATQIVDLVKNMLGGGEDYDENT